MPTARARPLSIAACLAALHTSAAAAHAQLTARAAYDSANALRQRAESLWTRGDARGLETLQDALAFLARPDVRDLAQGWPYLRSRLPDTWWDLARAATLRGDTSAALHAFEMVPRTGGSSVFARLFREDSVARRWLSHPRYRRALAELRQHARLWGDSAFVSAFRDTLPEAERLAGLALVWSEVRYGYPDFAARPDLDWDALYLAYIPRVQRAAGTFDYYRELQRFAAELGDGHTNVYFPPEIYARLARPPVATRRVEGRVLVTDVRSASLARGGLRAGDEIETVDGVPVDDYARERVAPFQSAATPQDLEARVYTYQLLAGPRDSAVRLGVRHADGRRETLAVRRASYDDLAPPRPAVFDTTLAGGVGYLRIASFASDSGPTWSRAAMVRLLHTRGLVLDLRENGGGNTDFTVLSILARGESDASAQRTRGYSALDRARGIEPQVFELGSSRVRPDARLHYDGPVVLLIGPQTYSAAEDFAAAFDAMRRGTIVGEPSGGSTGQPLGFALPGGGSARVRTKHDYYADGREFLFAGVQPAVVARPTVAGVRAGRDEALEAALRVLRDR